MKKVLLFSFFLVLGLVVSQMLPAMVGEQYSLVKTISNTFLFIWKLGRLEGEPVAKPVRRAYLGGYLVYDVGRRRAKSLLGV